MKHLKLCSSQRAAGSTSIADFRLDLAGDPVEGRFKLVEFYGPNSAYNVNSTNNTLDWNEVKGSGHVNATVTAGYYTASSLAAAVSAAMTAATTSASTYTCAYSASAG